MTKIPDFFLVGAAKSGTTSLFHYLIQHPSIYIPEVKEPHFFSDYSQPRAPRLNSLDDYLKLFSGCPDRCIAGDASTSYLYSPRAARRIQELNPDALILMVLRNPIDRAYSFYWHNRREFAEPLSFEEALDAEPSRIRESAPFRYHYVTSGLYYEQVERYYDVFGPSAVSVYLFDDLEQNTDELCKNIFTSLGLHPDVSVKTGRVFNPGGPNRSRLIGWITSPQFPAKRPIRFFFPNLSRQVKYQLLKLNVQSPPAMNPETRERLRDTFIEDIEKLEVLIGRDLGAWKYRAPQQSRKQA